MTAKPQIITRSLALIGTVLVWLPLLSVLVIALIGDINSGLLRFDYLIPAEIFPAALIGGLLLLWSGWRSQLHFASFAWGLAAATAFFITNRVLAEITGLASGAVEPVTWHSVVVVVFVVLYVLALLQMGTVGLMLMKDLGYFR